MKPEDKNKKYVYVGECPIVYAMELIGSKWKMPILWNLTHHGELHYNELRRSVRGITNTMLTRCLRELEEAKLIIRSSEDTVPPSVTYHLSEIGEKLVPSLDGLYQWGEDYINLYFKMSEED